MGSRDHGLSEESPKVKREGRASADYLRVRKRGSWQGEAFPVYCQAGRGEASERSHMRMARLWCRKWDVRRGQGRARIGVTCVCAEAKPAEGSARPDNWPSTESRGQQASEARKVFRARADTQS